MTGRRIVLATFGSLGDLHPFVAVARGLKARGHRPVVAAMPGYRDRVEAAGVGFHPVRPAADDAGDEAEVYRRAFDPWAGPRFLVRDVVMAHVRQSYADLTAAAGGADLLVSHPLTPAAQVVAEVRRGRLRWASAALAPATLWSAYDPPHMGPLRWLGWLRPARPWAVRAAYRALGWAAAGWSRPWHELRAEVGLPPTRRDPLFDGQFSPDLTLGLFSPALAGRQPDWPPNVRLTGFPAYDGPADLDPRLAEFLAAGDPPVVFTLGSAAVWAGRSFYADSAAAAARLGRRAVLLVGGDPANRPPALPADALAVGYAPYSQLFPRAAAVVHSGGIGTTGRALRAGRPMVVVPFAFDQPDNAARVKRLGVGRVVGRSAYTATTAARELGRVLSDPGYAGRAAEVGRQVAAEDGVSAACDAIDELLAGRSA